MKVERIKERVEEKEGIPPQQQRLIYSGKQMWVPPSVLLVALTSSYFFSSYRISLNHSPFSVSPLPLRNDEKTAADYKIQGGSVLHLVLALRGGSTLHRPCLHLSSSSWAAVAVGPAECQRFRCLSQSNHVTAQRSEIPRSRQMQTKRNKNHPTTAEKEKKRTFNFLCRCFFVNPHWLSEFDQLMQAPMQYRWQFENTVVFLLVNKCWSWSLRRPLTHPPTHRDKSLLRILKTDFY